MKCVQFKTFRKCLVQFIAAAEIIPEPEAWLSDEISQLIC